MIKYWGFYASQPCRTIIYVFRKLNIEYEHNEIRPRLDTRSEEYKKNVNKYGKCPVIEHDGVKMIESNAIAKYLWELYDTEEVLLPKTDYKMRQKIDALLDIHGHTLKPLFASTYFELRISQEVFGAKEPTEERKAEVMKSIDDAFKDIEDYASENEYLAGDRLTLADIQYYNNISNLITLLELKLDDYPHLKEWYEKMS